ncbi:hypothetical protein ACQ86E_05300 [Bradyrhizobium betae]|uniref:hypothetical protein n=1 Tax=Bradyrhizobium betae TaxID=244734 RepID=UPI003D675043
MIPLLANAIEAHGGLDRWNAHQRLTATIVTGGDLWALKGVDQDQGPRTMRIELQRERASIEPFGKPGQHTEFSPERIAIVAADGRVVAMRNNPRAAFARHDMRTHWDLLHRAYFNAYALWTYVTTPFLLALDGFEVREIKPWREGTEVWRGLRATFPAMIASHGREQDFYFGPDMLIRRHDYRVEIAGNFPAAQYVSEPVSVDGLTLPTRRRIYLRGDDLTPLRDELMVSIDLSDLRFD